MERLAKGLTKPCGEILGINKTAYKAVVSSSIEDKRYAHKD
jgi:hypothetical protein